MSEIYDEQGVPMRVGDVVKVYHFTAALRRKKHYMYKQVVRSWAFRDGTPALDLSHLDMTGETYTLHASDGGLMAGHEIVQSANGDYEDRARVSPAALQEKEAGE